MAEEIERRSWGQTRRFEFMEWKLFWEGRLNRRDIEEMFGVSTPQASVDLRNYRDTAGGNIIYDATEKGFLPSPDMRPQFLRVSANRLLLQLRAWLTGALQREDLWFRDLPPVDMTPDIVRHVDETLLRSLFRAIRQRQALAVRYQSLSGSRWRRIAPHALAFDGYRWHARAWCCERGDFRDFVLSRIDEVGALEPAAYEVEDDVEWTRKIKLELCAHPRLEAEQRQAIERDYHMTGGCREIEVRLSMAFYFIKRMNLDLPDLPPARAQIQMRNLEAVQAAIAQSKLDMAARVAARRAAAED
jgi:hypothetical protein